MQCEVPAAREDRLWGAQAVSPWGAGVLGGGGGAPTQAQECREETVYRTLGSLGVTAQPLLRSTPAGGIKGLAENPSVLFSPPFFKLQKMAVSHMLGPRLSSGARETQSTPSPSSPSRLCAIVLTIAL